MKHIIILFALLPLATQAQMEQIRQKVAAEYRAARPSKDVLVWRKNISIDGTWADIDYKDRSRSRWQLEIHLDRLTDMAVAYQQADKKSRRQLQPILKGIEHFFTAGYQNDNWWYTKIGIPRRMLALAYILDEELPPSLRQAINQNLQNIDAYDHPARPGGDRIQVLSNHAKVFLWQRDTIRAASLFKLIEAEAQIAPLEEIMHDAAGGLEVRNAYRPAGRGVQADMTFHHRGDRVNSTLTYGLELPVFFAYWASLLENTPWQFSSDRICFVIDYYLDAVTRHLVCGRYFEPSAFNRELSRPDEGTIDSQLATLLLTISHGYRAHELQHFIAVQEGRSKHQASYAHHFWQSEYFVFSRPSFQTAVRLHSRRNANQEAAHNSEGLRNHFRGDGTSMLSITGDEYHGLWPVFDFRMIPGATTPLIAYTPLSSWGQVQLLQSRTVYAGAVCDSLYGAVAFDFKSSRNDLVAHKSWFFFDEGYVCLGSDICCTAPDSIVTTIEQCRQQLSCVRQGNWFFHGDHAYYVASGRAVAATGSRRGSWSNCTSDVAYASTEVCDSVFTLAIHHGRQPSGDSYAYVVCPNTSKPVEPWYTILQNGQGIQAVESTDGRLVYAAFYEASSIKTKRGIIEVDAPCIVMVRGDDVWVSDPARQHYQLRVSIADKAFSIALPTNLYAGKSVKAGSL